MQFSFVVLASLAAGLAAAKTPCFPPTFGCGTIYEPRCCAQGHGKRDFPQIPGVSCPVGYTEIGGECFAPKTVKRSGPACTHGTYGCGTRLQPRCCKLPTTTEDLPQDTLYA